MLSTPCKLPHLLCHLSGGSRGRILKCCCLRTDHNVFEFFTEAVAALGYPCPHFWRFGLAWQRVTNEDQLVCAENDKLAVCHKYLWWLVGVDSSKKGIDGICHRGDVLLALLLIEENKLTVTVAQLGGGGASRAVLGQVVCQRVVCGWNPTGHVIVDWPADLLLQTLKLFNLEDDKEWRHS